MSDRSRKAAPSNTARVVTPDSPPLDWKRIADWTDWIVSGETGDIAGVFAAEGLSAPVVHWSPREDDLLVEPLRVLLAYWSELRGTGAMPHYQQVDPVAMRSALGFVMLLEPIEGGCDFRYRLFGSIVARVSGFDMTGKLMSSHRASSYANELAIASTRACMQRRLPLYTERQPAGAERTVSWPRLALPLADDSGVVVRFLAGTVPIDREGRIIVA